MLKNAFILCFLFLKVLWWSCVAGADLMAASCLPPVPHESKQLVQAKTVITSLKRSTSNMSSSSNLSSDKEEKKRSESPSEGTVDKSQGLKKEISKVSCRSCFQSVWYIYGRSLKMSMSLSDAFKIVVVNFGVV